jgi:hypothetical protein
LKINKSKKKNMRDFCVGIGQANLAVVANDVDGSPLAEDGTDGIEARRECHELAAGVVDRDGVNLT